MSTEDLQRRFFNLLDGLNVTVYSTPTTPEDTLVCFGRLRPLTESDTNLKLAESRLLKFITSALISASESKSWYLRFSRPWVLKDNRLAFTWDFTIKGDLKAALSALEAIKVPGMVLREEVSVPLRPVRTKRGKVSAVRAS